MIRINLISAFRSIKNSVFFSTINVLGLSIGLASCFVIFQFLQEQWSYDKFHSNYKDIYRILHISEDKSSTIESAITFSVVANELNSSYPFVGSICRLHRVTSNTVVQYEDKTFIEQKIMGTDLSFFELFNFKFVYGSPEYALKSPTSIVITKSIAEKYFGDKDPLGKEMILDGAYGFWSSDGYKKRITHTVGGVIEDLPKNTHLDFDILVSLNLYSNLEGELKNWGKSFYTYLRVEDGSEANIMSKALKDIVEKYMPDEKISLKAQKAQEIYLTSNLKEEIKRNGSSKLNWLMAIVAIIILVVAGTNYVNFSIAKAIQTQKEVSIKKIFYANKKQLFQQLVVEAFLLNSIATILAVLLVFLLDPIIKEYIGFSFYIKLQDVYFWLSIMGITITSTLISGLYPAVLFSKTISRHVVSSLGNSMVFQGSVNKSLLIMQFTVSTLVIGFTGVVYTQMQFMEKKELGIDIANTLVINGPTVDRGDDSTYYSKLQNFKTAALRLPELDNIVLANFIPGKEIRGYAEGYVRKVTDENASDNLYYNENANSYYFTQVGYDFMDVFKTKLLAGRYFDEDHATDRQSIIINYEACKQLGFESPESAIGEIIHYRMNKTPTIIGVISDFHQHSLKRNYQPIIFEVRKNPYMYCYVKFNGTKDIAALNALNQLWTDIFPGNPFNYFFLDDFYSWQYQQEIKFMRIFGLFTFIAILIASLGIIGLTHFKASKLIREIGIRKTLGANYWDVLVIFGKGLSNYVLISSIISAPIIYLLSKQWLMDFLSKSHFHGGYL